MASSAMNFVALVFERVFATAHAERMTIEQRLARCIPGRLRRGG